MMRLTYSLSTGAIAVAVFAFVLTAIFRPYPEYAYYEDGSVKCRRYVKRNPQLQLVHHGLETWYYESGSPMCEREIWGMPLVGGADYLSLTEGEFPLIMSAFTSDAVEMNGFRISQLSCWLPDGTPCTAAEFHERFPYQWR